jgi:hypothetical protein
VVCGLLFVARFSACSARRFCRLLLGQFMVYSLWFMVDAVAGFGFVCCLWFEQFMIYSLWFLVVSVASPGPARQLRARERRTALSLPVPLRGFAVSRFTIAD